MVKKIRAKYSDGVLKPLEKLDLEEGAEVTLSIISETASDSAFRVVPNRSGFVDGIDERCLNRLNDEIEVEDFLAESAH